MINIIDDTDRPNIGPSLPLTVTTTGHKFTNYKHLTQAAWSLDTSIYGNIYRIWRPLAEELPWIICIHLIFLETTIIGLHYAADNIGLSSLKLFWWTHKFCLFLQEWCFSHSRSSKVTDVGANRKRICDSLDRNSNFGPILHRFRDFVGFLCSWPHPYSALILGVFPLHQITHVGVSPWISLKLFGREIIFEEFQPMWSQYLNVTDGETDRQTDMWEKVFSPTSYRRRSSRGVYVQRWPVDLSCIWFVFIYFILINR